MPVRCAWATSPLEAAYHDAEWGVPVHDDARLFEAITLEKAYGVEIALLIDIAREFGVHSLAQVDLGVRRHRNRPLEELRPMSMDVLRAALKRYSVHLPPQT